MSAVLETSIPGIPKRQGKVRDVYDFGDTLLIVATDRISAFDWILPTGIPDKGRILTQLSLFWFDRINCAHHLISTDPTDLALPAGTEIEPLLGRSMVVKKTKVLPVECIVRGYVSGSGWVDYQETGIVSGVQLPPGLQESEQLPEPIFTPSTKADEGHDMPISFEQVCELLGEETSNTLREKSLAIYSEAAKYARSKGIILADTKFEFGVLDSGEIILIDEVLTPDSSRFWPENDYEIGRSQLSFDKQYVREWLLTTTWDRNSPPPELPEDIAQNTRAKYLEAYEILSGKKFVG
ncbi:MAG: phosphoribosylaminoimidazolesuccinocarboxamide synthase [Planctomycetaceae bacterium]|nr:phosphoribosylaminoimidazolesuccinocarboxamide synthase [Planctomycetaceae bacterium]